MWHGDGYCEDYHNHKDCNFDGGDCCGDNVNTDYCDDCECLDPNFGLTTTTKDPYSCENNWSDKKCEQKKMKGDCSKENVKENCKKTCTIGKSIF